MYVSPIRDKNPIYTTMPVSPAVNAQQSFGGGWGDFLDGVGDTFGTLMDGAIKFEQFRNVKDASGQGQSELVNGVTKPYQTNAKPINEQQYQQIANGAAGQASGAGVNSNMLMIGGAALVALVLILK